VSGRKNFAIAASVAALIVAFAVAPSSASANVVDDLLNGVNNTLDNVRNTVSGSTGGGSGAPAPAPAPAPAATPVPQSSGAPPALDPTTPHGSGEDVSANLLGLGENTVGGTSGSQDENGDYHGKVTVLALLGHDVITAESDEGESVDSPLKPLNDILDQLCEATQSAVCLNVLDYNSTTTNKGSQNSFSVLRAGLLNNAVTAGAVESNGNIEEGGGCQAAHGDSNVADVQVGDPVTGLNADALQSTSDSEACNDGSENVDASSTVTDVAGIQLLKTLQSCDEDEVNSDLDVLGLGLITGTCNADLTGHSPFNVREALEAVVLNADVAGVTGGASQSAAEAPKGPGAECPDPSNPDCPQPPEACPDPSDPSCPTGPGGPGGPGDGGPGGPAGPGGPSGEASGNLPFTGADMTWLALIGGTVMALGLGAMALADRRRRSADPAALVALGKYSRS
jgi:hypothetical protein